MLIDAAADLIVFGGLCNCNDCDGFIAFKKKREFTANPNFKYLIQIFVLIFNY